jgi:tRNA(Ile)-lysidine synthase
VKALGADGHRIVAAVSGGSDSTALIVALNSLRRKKKLELAAAHANHALRGEESDADERFVRDLCERLKVPLVCRRLAVPLRATERDEGIEATARDLRQQFFADAARELGAKFVATAHTADDQAETVLHRIIRGTGLAGLAGIPSARKLASSVVLIRPLLSLRRWDIVEFLAAVGQEFREDHSNRDRAFTRNRLRHELLPYLTEQFNPQVTDALGRLATLAAEAQTVVDRQVDRLRRRAVVKQSDLRIVLDIGPLRHAQPFLVCELLRQLWVTQAWPLQEIGQADLQRLADLVRIAHGACELPGGVMAKRSRGSLTIERSTASTESRQSLEPPQSAHFRQGRQKPS